MDLRRLLEILGGAFVGAGLTAVVYELGGASPGAVGTEGDPTAVDEQSANGAGSVAASGPSTSEGGMEAETGPTAAGVPAWRVPDEAGSYASFPPVFASEVPFDAEAEAAFPKHGLVETGAAIVRARPDLESARVGMLRAGTRVRTDAERTFGGGCSQGWHQVFPDGWVCLNAGLKVADEPPDDGLVDVRIPNVDEPMPLDYWRVNHDGTPFFHRLPSYGEQDLADASAKEWLAARGREPMPTHPEKRPKGVPAVVKEYLNAAYYVTIAGEHIKAKRRFLKTNRGVYVRKYQVAKKDGSEFKGLLLEKGAADLPVHWIVREMELQKRESEGSGILLGSGDILPRRTRHVFKRKIRLGDYDYYEDADGMLMRAYAVGVSDTIKRPPGIESDETWVHVDLSEQTLVAYEGDTPVFTTLVSTGKEKGMTPVGVHRVQSKFVVTSMRDQPVEEEAYSIEDVPWTQYFHNNVALHGAFWHGGFGLVRSHGCVNLSPSDARWLFGFTEPALPAGWAAAMPRDRASAVVITE